MIPVEASWRNLRSVSSIEQNVGGFEIGTEVASATMP